MSGSMKVLLAEDDEDTARFVERGLTELGHNLVVAATWAELAAPAFDGRV